MSNERIPAEGITQLWSSVTIAQIEELQKEGDYSTALTKLRFRQQGLEKLLAASPLDGAVDQATEALERQLQGIADEIQKLNELEFALEVQELQSQQAEIVEILTNDAEGDQAALLDKAVDLNKQLEELKKND